MTKPIARRTWVAAVALATMLGAGVYLLFLGAGSGKQKTNAEFVAAECAKGQHAQCIELARLHVIGDEVPIAVARARALVDDACASGIHWACAFTKDFSRFVVWAHDGACLHGRARSCRFVAEDHEMRDERKQAKDSYEKACKLGEKPSCDDLKRF